MFKNIFSFKGRIRRLEYGLSYLIYIIAINLIDYLLKGIPEAPILTLILIIPLIWFLIAQGAKRCHDKGNSGWYQIIPFYIFWMLFAESDYGMNQYGENPKGEGNINEIEEIGKIISD